MTEIAEYADELARKPPKEEYLGLGYSPRRAKLFEQFEKEARREAEAARLFGAVESTWPPGAWRRTQAVRDVWFEAVYGVTERELVEQHNACVREYKRLCLRPWAFKKRRAAEIQYIRVHCRLTKAKGLTTGWH